MNKIRESSRYLYTVCVSTAGAQKNGIKRWEQREKWKEDVSHVEKCSRLNEVTLIGVLAV